VRVYDLTALSEAVREATEAEDDVIRCYRRAARRRMKRRVVRVVLLAVSVALLVASWRWVVR
jgi:hypothetical protein